LILEYTPENLNLVSGIILKHLTPDLLPKKWININKTNPMFGHCHTSSACLQKVFGTKNIKLYRALDQWDVWHWWCVDKDGTLIDLTVDQYLSLNREPPYAQGTKASMLGFEYRKRVLRLLELVTYELSSNGTPLM
jgi:hypothetical protein